MRLKSSCNLSIFKRISFVVLLLFLFVFKNELHAQLTADFITLPSYDNNNNITVCQGSSILFVLEDQNNTNITPSTVVSWSFTGANISSSSMRTPFAVTFSGSGTAQLTLADGATTSTFSISVTATSAAPVTPTLNCSIPAATNTTIAQDGVTKFEYCPNPETGNHPFVFSLSTPLSCPSQISTASSVSLTHLGGVTPTYPISCPATTISRSYTQGFYYLVLRIQFANGCLFSKVYYLEIGKPSISINTSATAACDPGDYSLSFNSQVPGATYTVFWDYTNSTSLQNSYTHPNFPIFPQTVDHNYTFSPCVGTPPMAPVRQIKVKAENSCGVTWASPANITVSKKPEADYSHSSPQTICQGSNVIFTDISDPGVFIEANNECDTIHKRQWFISPNIVSPNVLSGTLGSYVMNTNGSTSINITFNTPGTYQVGLIAYNNACSPDTIIKTFVVNPIPVAAINPPLSTVLTCTNTPIVLTATGGGTYSWSNGTSLVGSSASLNVTSPGTYIVTVSNSFGCTDTASQVITQNIVPPTASISAPGNELNCNISSITLTGIGSGTFAWTNGTTPLGTGATLTVTSPGLYTLTVTGSNGCTSTATYNVVQNNTPPTITITAPTLELNCSTTSIVLTATGGGTYSWSNGSAIIGNTASITVNTTGTYTVTVTALNGCTASANQSITQNITPPSASISAPSTLLTCSNNSITLTASGGGSYSWSNGTTNVGTNAALSVTTPGTYTVTVTAANGCTATATQIITQNISAPTAAITAPVTELTCATSSVTLTATGGSSYLWSNSPTTAAINVSTPGNYIVTITGANGCTATANQVITQNITPPTPTISASATVLNCNTTSVTLTASGGVSYSWSNGTTVVGTGALLTVTAPGTYTVTVTAANGCSASATQIITQDNNAPAAAISASAPQLTCTTSSITLTATGGGTYSWSNGTTVVGNTAVLNLNTPGTYTVTVTAANGCTATATQTITQNITPPTAAIIASVNELTCSTLSATLTATGSGSYSWSNGTTNLGATASISVSNPGNYTVTITGSNGCTSSASQLITQNITLPTASIAPSVTVLTCSTSSIPLTAAGGGSYSWSNGSTVVGTAATLNVTTLGTYTVTITAANGCTSTATQTITQNNTAPTAAISSSATQLTCNTTSITLTATGGGSYSWSNGTSVLGSNPTLTVTAPGAYTVTVTAANGCTASAIENITQNTTVPSALITSTSTELTCSTTSINLTATGGVSYSWSNGTSVVGTTAALSVTTPGTYTVTVTAANGCTATAVQTITQNIAQPTAAITAPSTTVLTCTTTSIALSATGSGTYSWSFGTATIGSGSSVSATLPGTYTVTVTATNGCTASASIALTQNTTPPTAAIAAPSTTVLNCNTPSIL